MSFCIISACKEPLRILISIVSRRAVLCPAVAVAEELLADGILLKDLLELLGHGASAVDGDIRITALTNVLCRNVAAVGGALGASVLYRTAAAVSLTARTAFDTEVPDLIPDEGAVSLDKELVIFFTV